MNRFLFPKSSSKILDEFKRNGIDIYIESLKFKGHKVRKFKSEENWNGQKNIFLFVHGTPGSAMNYKFFFKDSNLREKGYLLSYDRIGYSPYKTGDTLNSIANEVELVKEILKPFPKSKIVLVGYSYGGSIALGVNQKYKKLILIAPSVEPNQELIPSLIKLYKCRVTRWLIPKVWQAASKEKLSHREQLESMQNTFIENPNDITYMQGEKDRIIFYENSLFLQKKIPENRFELKSFSNSGHEILWSKKKDILKILTNINN